MTIEPWELEVIKALGTRGPLTPLSLMPLSYPFAPEAAGRTAEAQRESKKAGYVLALVKDLMVKRLVVQVERKIDLSGEGWEVYKANRG